MKNLAKFKVWIVSKELDFAFCQSFNRVQKKPLKILLLSLSSPQLPLLIGICFICFCFVACWSHTCNCDWVFILVEKKNRKSELWHGSLNELPLETSICSFSKKIFHYHLDQLLYLVFWTTGTIDAPIWLFLVDTYFFYYSILFILGSDLCLVWQHF